MEDGNRMRKKWVFTLNNYEMGINWTDHFSLPQHQIERAVWGFEVGRFRGTRHLQGYLELTRTRRRQFVAGILPRAYWNYAKKSALANYRYVTKSGNFETIGNFDAEIRLLSSLKTPNYKILAGLIDEDEEIEAHIRISPDYSTQALYFDRTARYLKDLRRRNRAYDKWSEVLLRPWQFESLRAVMTQNDRQICWVHDERGNSGKSYLAKYLKNLYHFLYLDGTMSAYDIVFMLDERMKGVVLDVCRDASVEFDYSALEALKNGYLATGKYKGKVIQFDELRVVVFANFEPNLAKLSADRWQVLKIGEGQLQDLSLEPSINPRAHFPYERPPRMPDLKRPFCLNSFLNERLGFDAEEQESDFPPLIQQIPQLNVPSQQEQQQQQLQQVIEPVFQFPASGDGGLQQHVIDVEVHQNPQSQEYQVISLAPFSQFSPAFVAAAANVQNQQPQQPTLTFINHTVSSTDGQSMLMMPNETEEHVDELLRTNLFMTQLTPTQDDHTIPVLTTIESSQSSNSSLDLQLEPSGSSVQPSADEQQMQLRKPIAAVRRFVPEEIADDPRTSAITEVPSGNRAVPGPSTVRVNPPRTASGRLSLGRPRTQSKRTVTDFDDISSDSDFEIPRGRQRRQPTNSHQSRFQTKLATKRGRKN